MVPNIKNAGSLDFAQYLAAFDDLVGRARNGKLTPADFQGTTISLTNPGTVGTMASIPRLMVGQGAIIAVGAMDYSAEYPRRRSRNAAALGISKVMTMTCTYDHRIIQGAESGAFLGSVQALLDGENGFYEEVFQALADPVSAGEVGDRPAAAARSSSGSDLTVDASKEAAVLQLINAYRVRGHLMADLDPLGSASRAIMPSSIRSPTA